jgi:ElaB/YqjD/DUF883 family membrane-anchored ribosome-binding protein
VYHEKNTNINLKEEQIMSTNQMKDRIAEELKKAKEAGQLTTEKVHDIVRGAVSAAVAETRGGVATLRDVVKDSVTTSVEYLTKAGTDAKETVEGTVGAVEGAIAGARSRGDQALETTRQEFWKLETRLAEEKSRLAQNLREGLKGVQEAGAVMSEDAKKRVAATVSDIKLKSTELLGLTRQTVKEAVKQAIESGQDVEETVARITGDATEKALKEGRFRADRVKQIAEKVLSGAVEAAEETGKEVQDVTAGAFEGAQKGIISAVESAENRSKSFLGEDLAQTKEDLAENRSKSFLGEDLAQTKEDLEVIEGLFIEATRKVASRSGEEATKVLNDLADQAVKTTSVLREKSHSAAQTVAERLKQTGKDTVKATAKAAGKVADVMAEEVKELGKRSVTVARGAISGMLKGAKEALKKKKEQ